MNLSDLPTQARDWFGVTVVAVLGVLGIRLHASRVNRDVAKNDSEAQHSSGLFEDLGYWRTSTERAYEQIRVLETKLAQAELQLGLRDERLQRAEARCERLTRFAISREPALAVWLRSEPGDLMDRPEFTPPPPKEG